MSSVVARHGDHLDKLLRIFKKQIEKAGILGELKKRQFYDKPSIKRKKKSIAARKRVLKQKRKLGLD